MLCAAFSHDNFTFQAIEVDMVAVDDGDRQLDVIAMRNAFEIWFS